MNRRVGLRAKLILLLVLLLTAIFTIVTLTLVRNNTRTLRSNLRSNTSSFAALATKPIGDAFVLYKDSGQIKIQQQVDGFTGLDANISNIAVTDTTGTILYSRHGSLANINKNQASGLKPIYETNQKGELVRIIQPYVDDTGQHGYNLVYEISNDSINQNIRQTVLSILILSLVSLSASIIAAYFLINHFFVHPLQAVSRMALQVSAGNYDSEIHVKQHDEIGDTAEAVRKMAGSLKADIAKLKETDTLKSEFMVISSHNLRTPLTSLRGYVELLKEKQQDNETQKYIDIIGASIERLHVFAEDMLTIAQIESGQLDKVESSPVLLNELLQEISKEVTVLASQKNVQVMLNLPAGETTKVLGSPQQLRTALWNVCDNALKFSKQEGGRIDIALVKRDGKAVLTVSDSGIGIAPDELPKLFTKFHRGTGLEAYNYEGTGLGLYITKLITERHHGTIVVESVLERGTSVTISLPLDNRA